MSSSDIGSTLWGLAAHLFSTRSKPESAFQELVRRTCAPCVPSDVSTAKNLTSLRDTQWHRIMCERYSLLRNSLRGSRTADLDEVADMARSLYPNGCSTSDFAETVQTCTAMLSFTIPSEAVDAFIDKKSDEIVSLRLHEISASQLSAWMADELLLDAAVPPRWYAETAPVWAVRGSQSTARRIALRLDPMAIFVEYQSPGSAIRHRRIPLGAALPLPGPTGPIARRLAQSHGWLLPEAELQRLLIKLQHLHAKRALEEEEHKAHQPSSRDGAKLSESGFVRDESSLGGIAASGATAAQSPPAASELRSQSGPPKKQDRGPQKADVGLLYRDPEAALHNVDLNTADDVTLQEFKDVMSEKFHANTLKPGDPGYQYDRRVDVAPPTAKSAWDDDSDDDNE